MQDASATRRLFVDEDGKICCGEPGRSKGKLCGKPILIEGLVADKSHHEFPLEALLAARVKARQDTVDGFLGRYYTLQLTPATVDILADYRHIEGLMLLGPQEIEQAFLGPNGENPLGLSPGWCPRIPLPETWTPENMERLAELCQTEDWNTTPILWLALPEVAGQPTSLVSQYDWYGAAHDGLGPGKIRQDIMWSNWFAGRKKDYHWAYEPAVDEPGWKIGYELPHWSTELNWENQQKAAQYCDLTISTVPSDALMLNLVAVVTGKKLRRHAYARTATLCDGFPLVVDFYEEGLCVCRCWFPEDARGRLGLAAEGVPKALGF